ncbi:MAG: mandelate racemase [Dehalococcoidia bacterium]|nr:MAG: mandelate racemase [Dehalococcoidia bacterium]
MKITDVKATVIRAQSPFGGYAGSLANLVQILTDEGIEGDYLVGGTIRTVGRGLADIIVEVIKPMLIGLDPFDREKIWDMMVNRHGGGVVSMNIVGAIDVALWDIAGKATGLPIYKLLGGYRDKIRAYASILAQESLQGFYDYAKELVEKGYTAIKLHVRGTPEDHIEACRITRDAVGDKVDLMLDSTCSYDRREALMVGRELEKLHFYWYEEPLPNTDIEGYRELCHILDIPVAGTEAMYTANPSHFTPYIAEHIVDIVRTDAERGITLAKKVAEMSDVFGIKCELHGWGYATSQFANLHIAGAFKNSDFFEKMEPGEQYDVCAKDTIQIDSEGFVHMPSKPGLGLELDFEEIKNRTILAF